MINVSESIPIPNSKIEQPHGAAADLELWEEEVAKLSYQEQAEIDGVYRALQALRAAYGSSAELALAKTMLEIAKREGQ